MIQIWKLYRCNRCYNVRILAMSAKPFCDLCKKARMNVERWYV